MFIESEEGSCYSPFLAFCKACRLNRKRKYDLVWSIMANRAGFASLFFKMWNPKAKYLLTLQEGDALNYPEKRMGLFKIFIGGLFKKFSEKPIMFKLSAIILPIGREAWA